MQQCIVIHIYPIEKIVASTCLAFGSSDVCVSGGSHVHVHVCFIDAKDIDIRQASVQHAHAIGVFVVKDYDRAGAAVSRRRTCLFLSLQIMSPRTLLSCMKNRKM